MGYYRLPGPTLHDEKKAKAREATAHEKAVKAAVLKRDGRGCRWPECKHWKEGIRVEAAHVIAAGMGGDPKSQRMTDDNLIRLCHLHHRGPVSLHSGDLRITPLTSLGTNGPVKFEIAQVSYPHGGYHCIWREVARERSVGVLESAAMRAQLNQPGDFSDY